MFPFKAKRKTSKSRYFFDRLALPEDEPARTIARAKNLLAYTKTSGVTYAGYEHQAGYHTIEFLGAIIQGQRNPKTRLEKIPYDFVGKTVLDIGCNQGGMLHAVANQITWGVGIDYDYRLINAANFLRKGAKNDRLSFYVHNLETDPLDLIRDMLPSHRVDVCFLLAVCMWIDNWRDVVRFGADVADVMIFESNGSPKQQDEQVAFLHSIFTTCDRLTTESSDDAGKKARQMFICRQLA